MVKAVFDEAAKPRPKNHFTIGIRDDVTHTSLDFDPEFSTEDPATVRCLFYGLGADAENPAAAFSLTTSLPQWLRRPFLLLVSSLASIAIAIWYLQLKQPDGLLGSSFTFIIAGAVGKVVSSLASDVLMPIISLALPAGDWRTMTIVLTHKADGAADKVLAIGNFAGTVVDFLIIAIVVYVLTKNLTKPAA